VPASCRENSYWEGVTGWVGDEVSSHCIPPAELPFRWFRPHATPAETGSSPVMDARLPSEKNSPGSQQIAKFAPAQTPGHLPARLQHQSGAPASARHLQENILKPNRQKPERTETPRVPTTESGSISPADTATLLGKAHRVLLHYRPGTALPEQLSRVRAMLDAHMFGRDSRAVRDDVVDVARQIDQVLPALRL
jgi:hypothetical protein